MTATEFLDRSGLATLWNRIASAFLPRRTAEKLYVKKEDVATVNGASLTHGGNVSVLAIDTDTLTIDGSVTKDSSNPVSGGGVYNYTHEVVENFDGGFYVS